MADIFFKLENQLLTKMNEIVLSSGDSGTDTCSFEFDENWDGYVRTAVFYQSKKNVQYVLLDGNDSCKIPQDAMAKAGIMYVGIFGVKSGGTILTSTVERVEIRQGAVDSGTMELEPSGDIFIQIVANYQAVLKKCEKIDTDYENMLAAIERQNAILNTLNAFDVDNINTRMDEIEKIIRKVMELGDDFRKNFRINNVHVLFEDGIFNYEDERITKDTLCDVYFDVLCVDAASAAIVSVESFDGYIRFSSTYSCTDVLTCSIYCMGV